MTASSTPSSCVPGVKWQTTKDFTPTRDFNADDVVFSFERQRDPNHPYHKVSGGTYEYFESMDMGNLLKSVEKVDDLTVKFTLAAPQAPFIANMAMDFASIMSAEYADQMMKAGTPEKFDLNPVGTGPFQLVAYQPDAVIRYKANADYWAGKAAIDNLIFAITPDASVRYQKLKAGECQVMAYPNPADLPAMAADPAVNLLKQEGLNVGYLAFNNEKKPYDDVRVRKALSMAVNKAAILDAVFQGSGTAAKNPIPPTIWSYNDAIVDDPYDPEAAKKLLAEAGITGLKPKLWAMPVSRPYNPNAKRMAEMIQADWKAVGVDAEIVSYEWGEYLKRTKEGEHETVLLGWTGDNGDPGQLPVRAAELRGGQGRQQPGALVQQGVQRADHQGAAVERPCRAHQALRGGAGGVQARGPLADDRALGRLSAAGQERGRLQDRPVRHAHVLRRRHRRADVACSRLAGEQAGGLECRVERDVAAVAATGSSRPGRDHR